MSTSSPDSQKISLKIIEAIKQHPVLYISEIKGNAVKLQEFRQKVWKRISDELGLDPSWVKLKWKNLRDTYCRILKYKNKSSKGLRRKKWIFEDHLSFLKFPYEPNYKVQWIELTEEYINDINTEVIGSQDVLDQLNDSVEDDDYSEYLEILEKDMNLDEEMRVFCESENNDNVSLETNHDQNLQQVMVDVNAKHIQSKFRKIRPKKLHQKTNFMLTPIYINTPPIISLHNSKVQNISKIKKLTKSLSIENSFNYEGGTEDFFKSISQTVKKLSPKTQADIKMDICKIVSVAGTCDFKQSELNLHNSNDVPGTIPKLVLVPCHIIDNKKNQL